MSLFENDEYQWRETYFILFKDDRHPTAEHAENALRSLGANFEISNVRANDRGQLESLTLIAPDDYAAMDITFVTGDEVEEQMPDLVDQLRESAAPEEAEIINQIEKCRSRFDVFHFEQLVFVGRTQEDEIDDFMDPGTVLIVMQKLAGLCGGIVVDPQAGELL